LVLKPKHTKKVLNRAKLSSRESVEGVCLPVCRLGPPDADVVDLLLREGRFGSRTIEAANCGTGLRHHQRGDGLPALQLKGPCKSLTGVDLVCVSYNLKRLFALKNLTVAA